MDEREGDKVKRPKKNKPCGYNLPEGGQCQKFQQYGRGNLHHYCQRHFNEWSVINASARDVPTESTLVVETNTTTTVNESNLGIYHDDN